MLIEHIATDPFPEEGHVFLDRIQSICLELILCPISEEDQTHALFTALSTLEPRHIILAARVVAHLPEDHTDAALYLIHDQFKMPLIDTEVSRFIRTGYMMTFLNCSYLFFHIVNDCLENSGICPTFDILSFKRPFCPIH